MQNPFNIQGNLRQKADKGVWEPFLGTAKLTYDFSVDGGAIGLITPANSPLIPKNAIVYGGFIDVITPVLSGGAATISLGTSAGSSAASLKAAVILGTEFGAGLHALVPVFTAGSAFKMTAAGLITLTVAAFVLTAGKFEVDVVYFMGGE